jgi:hypothetical protein
MDFFASRHPKGTAISELRARDEIGRWNLEQEKKNNEFVEVAWMGGKKKATASFGHTAFPRYNISEIGIMYRTMCS